MASVSENFKINLNQNLWVLVVSFGSLGLSEYYLLDTLYWFSLIASVVSLISLAFTTWAYTANYVANKRNKGT
jgi:hypothetical protein